MVKPRERLRGVFAISMPEVHKVDFCGKASISITYGCHVGEIGESTGAISQKLNLAY